MVRTVGIWFLNAFGWLIYCGGFVIKYVVLIGVGVIYCGLFKLVLIALKGILMFLGNKIDRE